MHHLQWICQSQYQHTASALPTPTACKENRLNEIVTDAFVMYLPTVDQLSADAFSDRLANESDSLPLPLLMCVLQVLPVFYVDTKCVYLAFFS